MALRLRVAAVPCMIQQAPFPVARSRAAHCAATPPGCWRSHSLVRVRRRFLRPPRQGVPPAELWCPGRRPVPVADDGIPPRSQLDLSVQTRGIPSPSSLCRESRCRPGPTCFSVPSLAAGRPLSISPAPNSRSSQRYRALRPIRADAELTAFIGDIAAGRLKISSPRQQQHVDSSIDRSRSRAAAPRAAATTANTEPTAATCPRRQLKCRQEAQGSRGHLTRGRALSTGKAQQGARGGEQTQATRHWPFPKARGSNKKHYILPLGMANRMRLRMRMDSQSQSHALSRGGCASQRCRNGSLESVRAKPTHNRPRRWTST